MQKRRNSARSSLCSGLAWRNIKPAVFRAVGRPAAARPACARAVCDKKLILWDEPAAGLDALVTTQLYETIAQLNREGITVIMVTHDLGEALPYASKVIHMGREQVWCMEKKRVCKKRIGAIAVRPARLTDSTKIGVVFVCFPC